MIRGPVDHLMIIQLRKEAEKKLNRMVLNRMEVQDRILSSGAVMEIEDSQDLAQDDLTTLIPCRTYATIGLLSFLRR